MRNVLSEGDSFTTYVGVETFIIAAKQIVNITLRWTLGASWGIIIKILPQSAEQTEPRTQPSSGSWHNGKTWPQEAPRHWIMTTWGAADLANCGPKVFGASLFPTHSLFHFLSLSLSYTQRIELRCGCRLATKVGSVFRGSVSYKSAASFWLW